MLVRCAGMPEGVVFVPKSGTIAPNSSFQAEATITAGEAGSFVYPIDCVIQHGEVVQLDLFVDVRQAGVVFAAPRIHFGTMQRGSARTADVVLRNESMTGPVAWEVEAINVGGNRVELEPSQGVVPAGGDAIVIATCFGDAAGE